MNFLLRDLLITVLPNYLEHFAAEPCDAGSPSPPGAPPPPPPGPDTVLIGDLGTLELRLILQLALMQLGGALRADEIRPRSVQELDSLEQSLLQALEQVRGIRRKMGVAD